MQERARARGLPDAREVTRAHCHNAWYLTTPHHHDLHHVYHSVAIRCDMWWFRLVIVVLKFCVCRLPDGVAPFVVYRHVCMPKSRAIAITRFSEGSRCSSTRRWISLPKSPAHASYTSAVLHCPSTTQCIMTYDAGLENVQRFSLPAIAHAPQSIDKNARQKVPSYPVNDSSPLQHASRSIPDRLRSI
jgi:hypothetical protein